MKKCDFYGITGADVVGSSFLCRLTLLTVKMNIYAYICKKESLQGRLSFDSIVRLRQIRPLFFSSSSISVPLIFFSAILIISFSAKLISASMSGFLSSA